MSRLRFLWVLCCCWIISLSLAQEATPEVQDGALDFGEAEVIALNGVAEGEITDRQPRLLYAFDGLRGDIITVRLDVLSGDLDPVMAIFDAQGNIFDIQDDANGELGGRILTQTLPRSDRYYISVARFGYALGTTRGTFQLELVREGVSSQPGSVLRYGDSVIHTITNSEPQVYYSFYAARGDIINLRMQRHSGDLDPYLQVIHMENGDFFVVAYNDDAPGDQAPNALISNLLIEESGLYIIEASRYGQSTGTTTGSFVLTIEAAANSGLGNSAQAPMEISYGQTVENTLSDDQYEQFYTFTARENDLVTVRMDRAGGRLDALLVIADSALRPLIQDDDSGGGQNALIEDFLIPSDGRYYIIATRFDGRNGTTSGRYRLILNSRGNAFDNVPPEIPRIRYGMTVTDNIDDAVPERLYAFWGEADDVITISMNRGDGDLDPMLLLLNNNQERIVRDDDSGGNQNALIERYSLPYTGVYYIKATRYDGTTGNPNTSGSFILVLAQRFD